MDVVARFITDGQTVSPISLFDAAVQTGPVLILPPGRQFTGTFMGSGAAGTALTVMTAAVCRYRSPSDCSAADSKSFPGT